MKIYRVQAGFVNHYDIENYIEVCVGLYSTKEKAIAKANWLWEHCHEQQKNRVLDEADKDETFDINWVDYQAEEVEDSGNFFIDK